ncbi:ABC transporter ATP-binding protein [Phytohabitans houttuyneae]|uniref:ABC transporter ATP-binding protein n=1 Tax=Phytohabitans houttuyneae TaxID=1076126 RepID=A0A6V8K112_9ACTN|nr:ABC transporter ATP-binding protein [Phytohabitans houttuyneae]GFJ75859.1 ABC transporter ATP-binding protein [Phytohabitans houttuyneae]
MTPTVALHGLTKSYGNVRAVDGLDLTIRPGEVVALLGPNGAGKSTTIDMLLGLARPDSGSALLFGMAPAAAIAAGRVGALLQSGGLLPDLTVREIVELSAALYAGHRAVPDVLARAGLTDLAGRRVAKLSGGQQQRVRFAMALVADPELIVLDEPTTGLDVEARRSFWAAMREESGHGRTVLFATHYLEEADAFADRIVFVRAGRVVADGTAAQIKAQVSGRTIRATLPGADPGALAGLPGVDEVETRGDAVLLTCRDSDAALRALITTTPAYDIEVTARGLEDAFVALTMEAVK